MYVNHDLQQNSTKWIDGFIFYTQSTMRTGPCKKQTSLHTQEEHEKTELGINYNAPEQVRM